LAFYTVGQREGLGISAPRPLYVLDLDVAHNSLIVGYAEELGHTALLAEEMHYTAGHPLSTGADVAAQIRYRAREAPATVWPQEEGRARIAFGEPLRDIAPGQAVVLYEGERVVAGGLIVQALCATRSAANPQGGDGTC
jgi:tRNA-specific 2-thiouridylase